MHRHPVTMVESVMVLCVLFLFFFGMLQIMEWFFGFIFCQYSAYYATKGMSLGYADYVTLRAARVAAMSISGPSNFSGNDSNSNYNRAKNYMSRGDASGVWYRYWGNINNRTGTQLKIIRTQNRSAVPQEITGRVFLSNSQYLGETDDDTGIGFFLRDSIHKDPYGKVQTIDNALYLEGH